PILVGGIVEKHWPKYALTEIIVIYQFFGSTIVYSQFPAVGKYQLGNRVSDNIHRLKIVIRTPRTHVSALLVAIEGETSYDARGVRSEYPGFCFVCRTALHAEGIAEAAVASFVGVANGPTLASKELYSSCFGGGDHVMGVLRGCLRQAVEDASVQGFVLPPVERFAF